MRALRSPRPSARNNRPAIASRERPGVSHRVSRKRRRDSGSKRAPERTLRRPLSKALERAMGIEPTTCSLGSCRSTTELRPRWLRDQSSGARAARGGGLRRSGWLQWGAGWVDPMLYKVEDASQIS
jgi:hypothetical protein